MTGAHLFLDESIRRDYVVTVAVIAPADLASIRKRLRGLLLPGQRSLHMKDEGDSRRKVILSSIESALTRAVLFQCRPVAGHAAAREECIRAAIELAVEVHAERLVLDRSDSTARADRRAIEEAMRKHGRPSETFTYRHQARHEEPLLWIADALAWSWGRKGEFHRRAQGLLELRHL